MRPLSYGATGGSHHFDDDDMHDFNSEDNNSVSSSASYDVKESSMASRCLRPIMLAGGLLVVSFGALSLSQYSGVAMSQGSASKLDTVGVRTTFFHLNSQHYKYKIY